MDNETRRELVRLLSLIVPRLFDDDPMPAIGRLRALAEKHGLHPTQLGISVLGADQVKDLERQLDEATMASWRAVSVFIAACHAKGHKTSTQIADVLGVPKSLIREWHDIGRVPAIYFSILAAAPTRHDRELELRGLMAEAKRRVRAEDKKRREKIRLLFITPNGGKTPPALLGLQAWADDQGEGASDTSGTGPTGTCLPSGPMMYGGK